MRNSKKGLELPVNMLVLLAIAIIVLLSSVAWFLLTFSGSTQSQLATQEFRNCCSKYVTATGCQADPTVWPYDPDATSGANAPPLAPNSGVCGFNDLNNDGRRNPIDATDKSTPEKVWSLQTLGGRIGTTDSTSIRRACGCPGAG